jgi:hypothetical protein
MTNYLGNTPVIGNFVKLDAISVVNGQAAYTMQNGGVNFVDYSSVNQFMVSLNSVIQSPGSSFTVSSSTITFASNLVTGDVIDFIIVFGNSLSAGEPTDATVSTAKIVDDAVTPPKTNFFNTDPGNAADLGNLHVKTGDSGVSSLSVSHDELVVESDGNAGISIIGGGSNQVGIAFGDSADPDNGRINYVHSDTSLRFINNASENMRIDSSGDLQFNSGFGSLTSVYGVRAWVVFDGNSGSITNSGNAEGNVSSVTRFGAGNYRVNFTNNMPDAEYYVAGSTIGNNYGTRQTFVVSDGGLKNVAYVNVQVSTTAPADHDNNRVNIAVIR